MHGISLPIDSRIRHNIADYPAVKFHFTCEETSGLRITDEVSGIVIDVSNPTYLGSSSFTPAHSITLKRSANGDVPTSKQWPVFSRSKYMILMLCCRPYLIGDAVNGMMPGGSNSVGSAFTFGTRLGMHSSVTDLADNTVSYTAGGGIDSTHQTTADVDCLLVMIYRPSGGLIECRCYNADGSQKWVNTYTNTPGVLTADMQPPAFSGMLLDADYPENSGYWHQARIYQHIAYEFIAEPADIDQAVLWHCIAPRTGQKSPYPGWKGKT